MEIVLKCLLGGLAVVSLGFFGQLVSAWITAGKIRKEKKNAAKDDAWTYEI